MTTLFTVFSPDFEKGKQADAHEFMHAAFAKIRECLPDEDANPVHRVFGGKTISKLQCLKCYQISNTLEQLTDLSLEIENVETLEDALDSFTNMEIIEVECENCQEQVFKEKRLLLEETPQIAVLHLKRFKNDQNTAKKIDKYVSYKSVLDLNPYTSQNQVIL
ncbi:hypothetical protein S83_034089 [Arachis hypogaea]